MPFEWVVALRFLREGRFQTALIVGGVAAGVAVFIFITALVNGLQANTIRRTLGTQAHIVVRPAEEVARPQRPPGAGTEAMPNVEARAQRLRTIDQWQPLEARSRATPGIVAVSPMATGPGFAVRGDARSPSRSSASIPSATTASWRSATSSSAASSACRLARR